jgi:hypothetical protein
MLQTPCGETRAVDVINRIRSLDHLQPSHLPPWLHAFLRVLVCLGVGLASLLVASRLSRLIYSHLYGRIGVPPLFAIVVIGIYAAVIVLMLRVTRFYRLWVFWRLPREQQRWTLIGDFLVALVVVTFAFVEIGIASVVDGHWFRFRTAEGPYTLGSISDSTFWVYYVWNFLDAIPVLKIPETLNWKAPVTFTDHASGALLLAYRVTMVIPLVGFIVGVVHVLTSARGDSDPEPG